MSKGYKAKHFYSVPINVQETASANKLFMVNESSFTFSQVVKNIKPIVTAEQWNANNNADVLLKRIKSRPDKWA